MFEKLKGGVMPILASAIFFLTILALLNPQVQNFARAAFSSNPRMIFGLSWIIAILTFLVVLCHVPLLVVPVFVVFLILAYAFIPATVTFNLGYKFLPKRESDFLSCSAFFVVILVWLPVEIGMTDVFLPWFRVYFHEFIYIFFCGMATVFLLFLFLLLLDFPGVKYNLPQNRDDWMPVFWGFLAAGLTLLPLAHYLKFIGTFSIPAELSWFKMLITPIIILVAIALPEEIVYRGLIQNWLTQKFGFSIGTLLVSSLIFGASHLNNYSILKDGTVTGSPPNWKYFILATIAGAIYGKVFQKSRSILSSAILHTIINTTRHLLFA